MDLILIIVLIAISLTISLIGRKVSRSFILMILSVLAIFALQPALPIRFADFWIPFATLVLTTAAWAITAQPEQRIWKTNRISIISLVLLLLVLGLTRYLPFSGVFTASRPPSIQHTLIAILLFLGLAIALFLVKNAHKYWLAIFTGFIISLFILLKSLSISYWASITLYRINGQYEGLASATDLRWLGFSYIAFRIIHTIRDRVSGRLPSVNLAEYITYVLFYPTLAAGPIDRLERFIGDLRSRVYLTSFDYYQAGSRILIGIFKKFVLADTLSLISLNATNANQVTSNGWIWIMVYAYAGQILFDFSGYTDIAIGLGRLVGISLPENFRMPYSRPNITQFWNNWHITLSQWFRSYFFNPLTRALRTKATFLPISMVILTTQLATMILIGLWHGISWNFLAWGIWHGLGLFIHNRWSNLVGPWIDNRSTTWRALANISGILLTFNFVALGWVFFALPNISLSFSVFALLIGIR